MKCQSTGSEKTEKDFTYEFKIVFTDICSTATVTPATMENVETALHLSLTLPIKTGPTVSN